MLEYSFSTVIPMGVIAVTALIFIFIAATEYANRRMH